MLRIIFGSELFLKFEVAIECLEIGIIDLLLLWINIVKDFE